jgi:hypothetical protein
MFALSLKIGAKIRNILIKYNFFYKFFVLCFEIRSYILNFNS